MASTEKPPKPRPDDAEAYPYVLTNQIGEGSFATVYRGYHVVSISQWMRQGESKADCPSVIFVEKQEGGSRQSSQDLNSQGKITRQPRV